MGEVMLNALNKTLLALTEELGAMPHSLEGMRLAPPDDLKVTDERLTRFFEEVCSRPPSVSLQSVRRLSRLVRVGLGHYRGSVLWMRAGSASEEIWNRTRPIESLLNSPNRWYGFDEEHTLGALLALAAWTPKCRAFFEAPWWEIQLLGRVEVRPAASVGTEARDSRHEGRIRYTLDPVLSLVRSRYGEGMVDPRGLVSRELIKRSRRGDRDLKPSKMPRTFDEAEKRARGLRAVDRVIDIEMRRLAALVELFSESTKVTQMRAARELVEEGVATIMRRLVDVGEVMLDGEAVRIVTEPLMPEIEASSPEGDGLRLAWRPSIERVMSLPGGGYVLLEGRVVRPLSKGFPAPMLSLLSEPLAPIPAGDVPRFIEKFALHCPVPMRLASGEVAGIKLAETIERRLFLDEDGASLVVSARFAYRVGDEGVEVVPGEGTPVVAVGGRGGSSTLLARQRDFEEAALDELREALSVEALPAGLEEEDAFDFLLDRLPQLSESWTVYGERSLSAHQVRGSLVPTVQVKSGVDWFDVDVGFEAGGVRAGLHDVIQAWLSGRRYYRLPDGSVARLPRRWLARHGEALTEIEELREATGGRLGVGAAPLAEGLLEEVERGEEEAARWLRVARGLRDFEAIPDLALEAPVEATMRDYQIRGVRWLAFLRAAGLGGLLADDMGLGKTLQVLAILADTHARRPGAPSLVVAPASVVENWALESQRFTPSLSVHVHHGKGRGPELPEVDLIVTSYNLMRIDAALFKKTRLRYAVLDEAQAIKNPRSKVSKCARRLKAEHRVALTGTPLENNLFDLWSVFEFIMPGFFGTQAAFGRRYARPIHKHADMDAMRAMRARIRPFVLRRLKAEVAPELPPRQEQVLYCELGTRQRALYEGLKEAYRGGVMDAVASRGVRGATIQLLEALMRLRQACCDARLLPLDDARTLGPSAKLKLLFKTLEQLVEAGHRTLIFSQWPSLLKLVQAGLRERKMEWLYLDGSTTKRQALVERWNEPTGPPVFLISLKAGGSGLNLTGADCVVHLDPWWNPAVESQATDRAHRIGQTRPVMVYKFVARDTVEEKILELQDRKRQLMEAAVDADRMLVDTLTREDLEAVFRSSKPGARGSADGP